MWFAEEVLYSVRMKDAEGESWIGVIFLWVVFHVSFPLNSLEFREKKFGGISDSRDSFLFFTLFQFLFYQVVKYSMINWKSFNRI